MTVVDQLALFEPSGDEIPKLALSHLAWSKKLRSQGEVFRSRGMSALAAHVEALARDHDEEAECLGMLAEFEHLAGFA